MANRRSVESVGKKERISMRSGRCMDRGARRRRHHLDLIEPKHGYLADDNRQGVCDQVQFHSLGPSRLVGMLDPCAIRIGGIRTEYNTISGGLAFALMQWSGQWEEAVLRAIRLGRAAPFKLQTRGAARSIQERCFRSSTEIWIPVLFPSSRLSNASLTLVVRLQ